MKIIKERQHLMGVCRYIFPFAFVLLFAFLLFNLVTAIDPYADLYVRFAHTVFIFFLSSFGYFVSRAGLSILRKE